MASQTGSIDLTASNSVKLAAEAGWQSDLENYATKAELDVQADRIGMVVANNDASSSLQLTADAMTYIGNNVTIKGTDGTTTAISGGRIQANSLSIGAFDSAAQSATLNSNISVGGRNLALDSKLMSHDAVASVPYAGMYSTAPKVERSDGFVAVAPKQGGNWTGLVVYMDSLGLAVGDLVAFSCLYEYQGCNANLHFYAMSLNSSGTRTYPTFDLRGSNGYSGNYHSVTQLAAISSSNPSGKVWVVAKWSQAAQDTIDAGGHVRFTFQVSNTTEVTSGGSVHLYATKLEKGNIATDWTPALEDMAVAVGGRNLLAYSGTGKNWSYSTFVDGVYTRSTTATSESYVIGRTAAPLELGETYTLSAWMKTNGQVSSVDMYLYDHAVKTIRFKKLDEITTEWALYTFTVTMPDSWVSGTNTVDGWDVRFDNNGSKTSGTEAILYVKEPKLEVGNTATDWSPAPEDVDSAISDAAKTATSYVTDITGGGIMVHPSDDATSGVRITSDVDIMRGGTSVINIGTNDAVRIGAEDNVQMLLAPAGLDIDNEAGNTIFAVESNSTGTKTVTVAAEVTTWAEETDVTTATNTVSDARAAAGDVMVTATVADTDYTLDSTYATATVTAGTGVSVALTSDGVDYVQSLMSDAEVTAGSLSVEYQRTVADSAQLAFNGNQIVTGVGRAIWLHNDQWSSDSQTETFYVAKNEFTGTAVMFGVGSGGYNRGVFDAFTGSWLIYRNQNGQTIIGGRNFSVSNAGAIKTSGGGHSNLGGRLTVSNRVTASDTGGQVSLVSGATTGNKGLWDETDGVWIIYRHPDYGIVLGNSAADTLYHRTSTCTVNSTNATIYNNVNHCWQNGAACTVSLSVNLKSSLANASTVDVATVPANYRPPYAVMGSVYVPNQNVNLQAEILGAGTIRLNNRSGSAVSTSANIYISFTFAL